MTIALPDLNCAGTAPDWSLSIQADAVQFAYFDRTSAMTIMQESPAEGADWPVAATAVGPRDSGIIIIEPPVGGNHLTRILTQRGESPVLLIGTCRPAP